MVPYMYLEDLRTSRIHRRELYDSTFIYFLLMATVQHERLLWRQAEVVSFDIHGPLLPRRGPGATIEMRPSGLFV